MVGGWQVYDEGAGKVSSAAVVAVLLLHGSAVNCQNLRSAATHSCTLLRLGLERDGGRGGHVYTTGWRWCRVHWGCACARKAALHVTLPDLLNCPWTAARQQVRHGVAGSVA